MLKALIKNKNKTTIMEFPLGRQQLADKLDSIGIQVPAHNICCFDDESNDLSVKIYGDTEFENKVASSVGRHNTLSSVNAFWEIYSNMPNHAREDVAESFYNSDIHTLEVFGQHVLKNRTSTLMEKYYCPLVVNVFPENEYGDLSEDPKEYGGEYAAEIEEEIRALIAKEDARMEEDLAEYFNGSNSAVAKLKSVKFSTQHVDGIVYGCIRAELTEEFTPKEEAEFKEWLEGQCSDGYGEGLEQRPIKTDDGEAYVSFWNADAFFLLNEEDFDDYLVQNQGMGGIQ